MGLVCEKLQAKRLHATARVLTEKNVPLDDAADALRHQPLQRDIERVEERDGRRPGRLALRQEVSRLAEIEVEARHLRLLERRPATRADRAHRQAGRHHPALLRAGSDDIEVPGIDRAGQRAEAADRVDEDQRIGADAADGGGERLQVVRDACRRLVVRQQHRRQLRILLQRICDEQRVGGRAPIEGEPLDLGAVRLGHRGESIAERADRNAEDAVARREHVHYQRFHRAGAGRRQRQHVMLGLEEALQARRDTVQHLGELRAAVVDHLAAHRLQNVVRTWRGARDA